MNTIVAKVDKIDYRDDWLFPNYYIDNFWLDEKLDELYPNNLYKGLVPTLLYGLTSREDEIVWNSILPNKGEVTICPILMCPDDYDFYCTLIVAEIENYGSFIQWKQLGIDNKTKWFDNEIEYDINWFPNFHPLNFEFRDYLKMIQTFRKQYQIEKEQDKNKLPCQ